MRDKLGFHSGTQFLLVEPSLDIRTAT